jgi:serine/threonine protein kinase
MQGIIKLCDFGLSSRKKIFDTNDFVGTVDYLSPESLNTGFYTEKIDIWAAGIILYEMIYRKPLMGNVSESEKYNYLARVNMN